MRLFDLGQRLITLYYTAAFLRTAEHMHGCIHRGQVTWQRLFKCHCIRASTLLVPS